MATIQYLTTVQFDHGAVQCLADELQRLGIRRPLVITDAGVRAAGLLARILEQMGSGEDMAVFDGTPANPTEDAVLDSCAQYRQQNCDGIVAVGGGSSIDLAKATALLATHGGDLEQYAAVHGGVSKITPRVAPVIAIPTTAGTGSEVGRASVIVMRSGRKLGLVSPHLLPKLAICDPDLTVGLPPYLTAATGMDAIAHCIETFLAPSINPPAEAIALDGLRRGMACIERATIDGNDRDARWNMMMAAMEGAMAFQKGLGAVHSLSHPLGALADLKLHHGTLNAVLLPAVIRFNAPEVKDKLTTLCAAMGIPADADPAEHIHLLNGRLGLPSGLAQMGVRQEHLQPIAESAPLDHCHATNPRVASVADYLSMLEASF